MVEVGELPLELGIALGVGTGAACGMLSDLVDDALQLTELGPVLVHGVLHQTVACGALCNREQKL